MGTAKWIYCPICKNKTRTKIRTDTKLINFPLYCPKCKQENLINASKLKIRARHLDAEPIIQRISYLIDYRLIFITYHHIPYDWQANKNGGTNLPPLPLI